MGTTQPYYSPNTNPNDKSIQASSRKLHLKHLLGVPDHWEGHEGEALIVSEDGTQADFNTVNTVVQDKARVDVAETSKYLGELIDLTTMEISGAPGSKVIGVKDELYFKLTGGSITGNINMVSGATIDGVDVSDLAARALDKYVPGTQSIASHIVLGGNLEGGNIEFLHLVDTPSDYTDKKNYVLAVNNAENALELIDVSSPVVGPHGINNHTDVNINNPTLNQIMSFDGSDWVNKSSASIDKVVTVGKGGSVDFNTIQDAIDSITVAADEKYNIKIAPGAYIENIIMKDDVSLKGMGTVGDTVISNTSGIIMRTGIGAGFPSNEFQNIKFQINAPSTNIPRCITIEGGRNTFINCTFDIDIEDGIINGIDQTGGVSTFNQCSWLFSHTGTGGGELNVLNVSGISIFNIEGGYCSFDSDCS